MIGSGRSRCSGVMIWSNVCVLYFGGGGAVSYALRYVLLWNPAYGLVISRGLVPAVTGNLKLPGCFPTPVLLLGLCCLKAVTLKTVLDVFQAPFLLGLCCFSTISCDFVINGCSTVTLGKYLSTFDGSYNVESTRSVMDVKTYLPWMSYCNSTWQIKQTFSYWVNFCSIQIKVVHSLGDVCATGPWKRDAVWCVPIFETSITLHVNSVINC